ncbi:LAMI_0D06304g1_1 [Lachancea mirantina]|uniref:LAMI_0D06304g1_1 n=1 Tax=Lachancea mirantina TaxID=1230905 RepID=A0A1G4JBQ0_9SACH|nr:LAMI_0D06304g1_1 [Lachancea mirantina]
MQDFFNLRKQLAFYQWYHQTPGNVAIHTVFVPVILYSAMVMLHHVHIYKDVTLMEIVAVLLSVYYLILDVPVGLLAALIITGVSYGIEQGPLDLRLWIAAVVFAVGWICQFLGHAYYEHRRPALLDNLVQSLMTAPFFVLFEVLFKLNLCKRLQADLEVEHQRRVAEENERSLLNP